MDFLKNIFGDPVPDGVNLVLITLLLVVILLLVVWAFRKFAGGPSIKTVRGRQPRLAVTDAANLDDKRRLVLVRRDDVEHLVMIGGATDVLLESNIVRAAPQMTPASVSNLEEPIEETQPETSTLGAVAGLGTVAGAAIGITDTDESTITPEASFDNDLAAESEMTTVKDEISSIAEGNSEPVVESVFEKIETDTEIEPEALASLENALDSELVDNVSQTDDIREAIPTSQSTETASNVVPEPSVSKTSDAPDVSSDPESPNMEDEMQKLLDELSGEKS